MSNSPNWNLTQCLRSHSTPQKLKQPKNEGSLQNEDDFKNDDNFKMKITLNEDDPKS